MDEASELSGHSGVHPWVAVAERCHGDTRPEVQIAFAAFIPKPNAFTTRKLQVEASVGGHDELLEQL